jgi:thioredoxin reductase (NADPH)
VIDGGRCVGVAACERECPVGAVVVEIANLEHRHDVPLLDEQLQSPHAIGLFLAGEVTAHALIKKAVEHGTAVANSAADRSKESAHQGDDELLDLLVVGAGPAGLAATLQAQHLGLCCELLDQEQDIGGTVARYPRDKLVLSQPFDLPLHGPMGARTYRKQELIELWTNLASEHQLPFQGGEQLLAVTEREAGGFTVTTNVRSRQANTECLALGRRGTPRQLSIPGEDLAKVAYDLLDARSFSNRHILVVGGGDSAVEAALGLSTQPGNTITLSYRREEFTRLRDRNQSELERARTDGKLTVVLNSKVTLISSGTVVLEIDGAIGENGRVVELPNENVFIMIGGVPPVELLGRCGVSFDPAERPAPRVRREQGSGVARALTIAFTMTLVALLFAVAQADYYLLPQDLRPAHEKHEWLRPGFGLGLGIAAVLFILVNQAYLLCRVGLLGMRFGSLAGWMTVHVATGNLALLCAMLHSTMSPKNTVGGHDFWALAALMVTGAIGRYLYAWVPRAANGRALALDEVRLRVQRLPEHHSEEHRAFGTQVRDEVLSLMSARQWRGSFAGRAFAFFGMQRDLRRTFATVRSGGRAQGIPAEVIAMDVRLTRQARSGALSVAHFEDLRALLSTWRYLHRWVAPLMVMLTALHIVFALFYRANYTFETLT